MADSMQGGVFSVLQQCHLALSMNGALYEKERGHRGSRSTKSSRALAASRSRQSLLAFSDKAAEWQRVQASLLRLPRTGVPPRPVPSQLSPCHRMFSGPDVPQASEAEFVAASDAESEGGEWGWDEGWGAARTPREDLARRHQQLEALRSQSQQLHRSITTQRADIRARQYVHRLLPEAPSAELPAQPRSPPLSRGGRPASSLGSRPASALGARRPASASSSAPRLRGRGAHRGAAASAGARSSSGGFRAQPAAFPGGFASEWIVPERYFAAAAAAAAVPAAAGPR